MSLPVAAGPLAVGILDAARLTGGRLRLLAVGATQVYLFSTGRGLTDDLERWNRTCPDVPAEVAEANVTVRDNYSS